MLPIIIPWPEAIFVYFTRSTLLLLVSMEREEIYASILFRTPVSMERTYMKSRISRRSTCKPEAKYIATVGGNMENKDPRVLQSDWRIQS